MVYFKFLVCLATIKVFQRIFSQFVDNNLDKKMCNKICNHCNLDKPYCSQEITQKCKCSSVGGVGSWGGHKEGFGNF